MPSLLLKQPNGKFAAFSSVSDYFVAYDMTEEEAIEFGVEEWGREVAKEKLARAIADVPFGKEDTVLDGLRRWRESLTDIALQHGLDGLRNHLSEIGFPDAEIPQSAVDAATTC